MFKGAVIAGRHFKHPVTLSRKIMENLHHCALTGDGAKEFAEKYGLDVCAPEDLITNGKEFTYEDYVSIVEQCFGSGSITQQDTQRYGDTVTAVAMDANGHFACATSTGIITVCISSLISVLRERAILFGFQRCQHQKSSMKYIMYKCANYFHHLTRLQL